MPDHSFIIAVIGDAFLHPGCDRDRLAEEIGEGIIDRGHYLLSGGMAGVMEAACRGGRRSAKHTAGRIVGIMPGFDQTGRNPYVDLALSTGLGHLRNTLVAQADAVVAIGGGAGTLSEICFAWLYKRMVIGVDAGGWSAKLAGHPLDERRRFPEIPNDCIHRAKNAQQVFSLLERLPEYVAARKDVAPRLGGF